LDFSIKAVNFSLSPRRACHPGLRGARLRTGAPGFGTPRRSIASGLRGMPSGRSMRFYENCTLGWKGERGGEPDLERGSWNWRKGEQRRGKRIWWMSHFGRETVAATPTDNKIIHRKHLVT